jgi:hypothetical protein
MLTRLWWFVVAMSLFADASSGRKTHGVVKVFPFPGRYTYVGIHQDEARDNDQIPPEYADSPTFAHRLTMDALTQHSSRRCVSVGTDRNQIHSVSRRFLDPRRPLGKPSKDDQEEMLIPYDPLIPPNPLWVVSHSNPVSLVVSFPPLTECAYPKRVFYLPGSRPSRVRQYVCDPGIDLTRTRVRPGPLRDEDQPVGYIRHLERELQQGPVGPHHAGATGGHHGRCTGGEFLIRRVFLRGVCLD